MVLSRISKLVTLSMLCILYTGILFAQDFSNRGTDFWVVYSGHIDALGSRMALYITSTVNTTGTVSVNGKSTPFTVIANQVSVVQLTSSTTPSNADAYLSNNNVSQLEIIGVNKGIHIVSQNPVVVYSHILNSARSGSTLVLPTKVLGREYVVATYKTTGNIVPLTGNNAEQQKNTQFEIIATEDGTTVEITPTNADYNNHHQANVTFDTTLNKGDVYQYQSFEDLTGTKIKSIAASNLSCKKIAVYSGSTWAAFGCSTAGTGDNLYQQLFPTSAWGKRYFTSPSINRKYDLFRILVQDPATPVYVNGVALSTGSIINNSFYEISTFGDNTYRDIYSDKPISVIQYFITMGCDGSTSGDPEIIALNPIEQTLNDITVMSARKDLTPPNTNISNHYLNIIFKTSALSSLKIDGSAPTATPNVMGTTGYSYIQEEVTNSTLVSPSHRIVCDSGFICIAYGYGNVESYGYNAGTNVVDLYQKLTVDNQYGTVKLPATCRGTPFKVSITLPYEPLSLEWDIPEYPNIPINYNPVYDSTYSVNGKTIYRYSLNQYLTYQKADTTYNIQLKVFNPTADGCSGEQTIDFDLVVYSPPKADYSIESTHCLGDSLKLMDNTQLGPEDRKLYAYNWKVGNAPFVNAKSYAPKINTVGTIPIQYYVITDIGCLSDTLQTQTVIDSLPKPNFIIPNIRCVEKDLQLVDSSFAAASTPIVKWIWNYGDFKLNDTLNANTTVQHRFDSAKNYAINLSVISANGCFQSKSKTTSIYYNPVAGFVMPEICLSDAFAAFRDTSSIADHSSPFTYSWDFGEPSNLSSPNTSNLANPRHAYVTAGNYTVKETVTSIKGCATEKEQTFTVNGANPRSNFSITDSAAHCSNTDLVLTNLSTVDFGSVGKLIIYWDSINNPLDTTIDENPYIQKKYMHRYANFHYPDKMSYDVRFTAFSGGTCLDYKQAKVNIVPPPTGMAVQTSKNYICVADSLQMIPVVQGGVAPYMYNWQTDNSNTTFKGNQLFGLNKGNVNVSATITDPYQCVYAYSNLKSLEVKEIPIAQLKARNVNICNGDAVVLEGAGANRYLWFKDGQSFATSIVDTLSTSIPGNYTLKVNDGYCNSLLTSPIQLTSFTIPTYTLSNTQLICKDKLVQINTNAADAMGAHFNWDFGDKSSSTMSNPRTHIYNESGKYFIQFNYKNDYCPKYDTTILGDSVNVVNPIKGKYFTLFVLSDVDTLITNIKSDPGYTQYTWQPATYLSDPFVDHPNFRGIKTTQYILTRTDPSSQCQVFDNYIIDVSNEVVVAVPKAFTPNKDGLNDILKLEYGAGLKRFNYFKLFNRWGKLIFESNDINIGWDGTYNGRDQEMDAYTYLLDYITFKDEHISKTGSVILLR